MTLIAFFHRQSDKTISKQRLPFYNKFTRFGVLVFFIDKNIKTTDVFEEIGKNGQVCIVALDILSTVTRPRSV